MTTTPEEPAGGRQPNAAEGMAREGAQPDVEGDRDAVVREGDDGTDPDGGSDRDSPATGTGTDAGDEPSD
jgi:hypothetical protein